MNEGWCAGDYLVIYSDAEVELSSDRYGIRDMLPGFRIVGLLSGDDFIMRNSAGAVFKVPTVPCVPEHLESFSLPPADELVTDERFGGKIKW